MIEGEGDPMNRRLQEQSAEKLSRYLGDERLMKMKAYIQHGNVTTYDHSVLVAYYSCMLAYKLRLRLDEHALIKGGCFMIIIYMIGMRKQHGINGMAFVTLILRQKTRCEILS